jgi:hypothetical protein
MEELTDLLNTSERALINLAGSFFSKKSPNNLDRSLQKPPVYGTTVINLGPDYREEFPDCDWYATSSMCGCNML